MALRFEFILIGEGLQDGTTVKGAECNPPTDECPKGVPSFNDDGDPNANAFLPDGFIQIQGDDYPEVLGGLHFDTHSEATVWLASSDGERFKQIYQNVYLVRVLAR